jgi:hypothetical protein
VLLTILRVEMQILPAAAAGVAIAASAAKAATVVNIFIDTSMLC